MPIPAHIEKTASPGSKRGSARRKLRLQLQGVKARGGDVDVLVHNISATGLLIESQTPLAVGDGIDVDLPHAGNTRASIIWASGRIYGCEFDAPVSSATLSAAQLRGAVGHSAPVQHQLAAQGFGARLHSLRLTKGLTQSQLAATLDISEPSISAWEKGKSRPKAARLEEVATALGVTLGELLGISHPKNLGEAVDHARTMIAEAAGLDPVQVRIRIVI